MPHLPESRAQLVTERASEALQGQRSLIAGWHDMGGSGAESVEQPGGTYYLRTDSTTAFAKSSVSGNQDHWLGRGRGNVEEGDVSFARRVDDLHAVGDALLHPLPCRTLKHDDDGRRQP